jgi:hypothetical protein
MIRGVLQGGAMNQTMAEPGSEPNLIRFSSGDWPEADRVKVIREIYGRKILPLDLELPSERPLNTDVTFRTLPGLTLAFVTSSAMVARRTRAYLVNDDLSLGVVLAGSRTLHQRGRDSVVHQGEAILSDGGESA